MEDGLHQRIQQFIDYLQITNNKFAKEIGDSSAKVSQVTNQNGSRPDFRVSLLAKIIRRYPELSMDWLFSGDGPMLKNAPAKHVPLDSSFDGEPPRPVTGWRARLLEAQQEKQTIPLVGQKAYASYLAGYADQDFFDTQPVIYYPELKGLGPVIAIRVQGDSMSPTIYPDDVLLCSYVERGQKIANEGVYVVCHEEGVVVKRVVDQTTAGGNLLCLSDNPEYPAFEVPITSLRHIWKVRRRITAFLDKNAELESKVAGLEQQISLLSKRLDA